MYRRRAYFTFIDIVFVLVAFMLMAWIKPGALLNVLPSYFEPILVLTGIWIIVSLLSGKYNFINNLNLREFATNTIVANFFTTSIVLNIIFIFKLPYQSRLVLFGTVTLASIFEFVYGVYYFYKPYLKETEELDNQFISNEAEPVLKEKIPFYEFAEISDINDSITGVLKDRYLFDTTQLFNFIDKNLLLKNIDKSKSHIIDTRSTYNINFVEAGTQQLFINLHKINDIQRVNKFFNQVNYILVSGGFYIGTANILELQKKHIFANYPRLLNSIYYYLIHFPITRVIPKLPYTKVLYFAITKGYNRVISRSEIMGRLYSCGFEMIAEMTFDNKWYFISRKIKPPVLDQRPTYGLFIRLKRIGKNGKLINIYKFRTMHPFSEYLQDYVYKINSLEEGGKFKDDFRVTSLGKFMRKFWLDEWPMFINWFRGELKLVGVRPLSKHYFSLYTDELKTKRLKHKPGIIPPFYADLPKTLDEIMASEMRYLNSFEKHPLITDFKYFWKAMFNIFFRKARSH